MTSLIPPTTVEIRAAVIRLFENARQSKSEPYDTERFLVFLTKSPISNGKRAADTFAGRRRFVRFMESVQLEFGVCFSNDEWDRGFTLDKFIECIESKIKKPEQAQRLAQKRFQESRAAIVNDPVKFGILAIPILLVAMMVQTVTIRVLFVVLWVGITFGILWLAAREYKYSKRLVDRTHQ